MEGRFRVLKTIIVVSDRDCIDDTRQNLAFLERVLAFGMERHTSESRASIFDVLDTQDRCEHESTY